jgi:phage terminase small subunit
MPRKSAAARAIAVPKTRGDRLYPGANLSPEIAEIFETIVAQVSADHFRASDEPLLEQYAQAVSLGRQAFAALEAEGPVLNGKPSPWVVVLEKAHRSSVALSARLRLSPQHRTDPKVVGRQNHSASAYDVMGGAEWMT